MEDRSDENNETNKDEDKKQQENSYHNPYSKLKMHSKSLFPDSQHVDDTFKLSPQKNSKRTVKRLKQIYPLDTPIFPEDCSQYYTKKLSMPRPTYLSQIKMLPVSYYKLLISPSYINKEGYYQVVVWKQGRMIKESVDDFIEYHQEQNRPILDQDFIAQPWLLILLKTWIKMKGGNDKVYQAEPFEFIRTFSFPIWDVINPCVQNKQEPRQQLLKKLSRVRNKNELFIAKTKAQPQVGYYGFYPGSASYKLTGYYQDYEKVFIKIKTFTYSKWNGKFFGQQSKLENEDKLLEENQFIMPLKQFLNVFNLVFFTFNFYSDPEKKVFYNRYHISVDARQTKAKLVTFKIQKQCEIGINTYFPASRTVDLYNPHPSKIQTKQEEQMRIIVPYCKILVGQLHENANLDASFVDSVRQNLLNDKNGDFISMKSHIQYQFIHCEFFKGYLNQVTFLLKLKPGRYYIRYKLQKIKSEYRIAFNTVATEQISLTDAKMAKQEMDEFLKQSLSSKARINERNITYVNPLKKGSWIIMNPDYDTVGYGYIVIQAIKNSENKIIAQIDTGMLKENGYCIKGMKNVTKKFNLTAEDGQSIVLIVKKIAQYQKEHVWPPPGIHFRKMRREI